MNTTSPPVALQAPTTLRQPTPAGGRRNSIDQVLWTFRGEVIWIVIFSAFANVLLLTPIVYMLQVFDRVMFSGNTLTLVAVTVFLVLFLGIMALAEWLRSRLLVRAGNRFDEVLNERVFTGGFAAQLNQQRQLPTQPLSDLNSLRQFLTGNGVFAVLDTPWALVFIGALFLLHPWLGWLSVVFAVIQLISGFVAHSMQKRSIKAGQELGMDASRYLQSKFRNAETVEAMGMAANLRTQWMALNARYLEQQAQSHETGARVQSFMKWMQYMQQGLMLSLGALLVIEGQISAGAMVAANSLMGIALRPIGLIVQTWSQFADAHASYRRLNELLDAQTPQPVDPPVPEVKGQISLKGLTATAASRKIPILHGIDLDFRAGEVVAIVGPSGAGKSTLARCILGIWPGATGQVLIDGHDIRSWPRPSLGQHIGYLPQDVELFEGTIADNISRFEKIDSGQVILAAQAAGIHEMVLRMPKGYDTPVGEAGDTLSGGQRQRLGLARALLRQPAIVVLDEPSANLDDQGEAALARAVQALKAKGSTVFMIVHQKNLLSLADRVLVLEAGRVAHFGAPVVVTGQPVPAVTPKP
jgi:ATP-binding cassette subfamily C exporter for protease/lipase